MRTKNRGNRTSHPSIWNKRVTICSIEKETIHKKDKNKTVERPHLKPKLGQYMEKKEK
jgi:hypothetical protein